MPEKRHMHMCLLFKGREPATAPIGPTAQQSAVGYNVVSLESTVVSKTEASHMPPLVVPYHLTLHVSPCMK